MKNIDARVLALNNNLIFLVLEKKKEVIIPGKESFTKHSLWGMPGGRGEDEDGDEIDTVIREVKEEIGLSAYINEQFRVEWQEKDYVRVGFIGELAKGTIRINPEEILDGKWFPRGILYDERFPIYLGHRQMAQELLRKLGK